MWVCPKCKHKFYNTNQSHSCGRYSLDDFLKSKTEIAVKLFHHVIKEYQAIGDFELHPVKTRVALLTLMRFASINKIGKDYVDGHLVLVEPFEAECFYKVDNLSDRFFVHHFRICEKSDVTPLK